MAFLSVEAEPPFVEVFALGIVAPAFHGLGLGAAIVSENERRARRFEALADPNARIVIHAGALADEPRVSALLSSRGYREVRRFELRRVDFSGKPRPAPRRRGHQRSRLPPRGGAPALRGSCGGVRRPLGRGQGNVRGLPPPSPGRAASTTPASGSLPGTETSSPATSARRRSRARTPRAATSRCWACAARTGAAVSGRRCCVRAFEALYARGRQGADLHVDADSLTGATRLYERVGMTAHPRFATWEKELRPARA